MHCKYNVRNFIVHRPKSINIKKAQLGLLVVIVNANDNCVLRDIRQLSLNGCSTVSSHFIAECYLKSLSLLFYDLINFYLPLFITTTRRCNIIKELMKLGSKCRTVKLTVMAKAAISNCFLLTEQYHLTSIFCVESYNIKVVLMNLINIHFTTKKPNFSDTFSISFMLQMLRYCNLNILTN